MTKKFILIPTLFVALLNASMGLPANAFDGTDASPPTIVSMKLLTQAPTEANRQIVIEVLTQDDKNWVKIAGNPQIGYSFPISNFNAPPNCAVVTTVFSKLEVVEDEQYRFNSYNSTPKKQRFALIGFAPKPKDLPSNCPEYRNLNANPAVALNATTFTPITNKNTKITTYESNILNPQIIDESGRSTSVTKNTNITPANLAFTPQATGPSTVLCVPPSLLPKNNSSIASAQSKYLGQLTIATEKKVGIDPDPVVDLFENQLKVWSRAATDFSLTSLNEMRGCTAALTSSQVINAYQEAQKKLISAITSAAKNQLLAECQTSNLKIQSIIDYRMIFNNEKFTSQEYSEFVRKSASLKIFDCEKVIATQLNEYQKQIQAAEETLNANLAMFLGEYCVKRDEKRVKYLDLKKQLAFRYGSTIEFSTSDLETATATYPICDPTVSLSDLLLFSNLTSNQILKINDLLSLLQSLEKSKKIKITIVCKSSNKQIKKSGMAAKCPVGYREIKPSLIRIV
jgi:DNA-directed RNA polymerase subunit N (RpoN/RPB10)